MDFNEIEGYGRHWEPDRSQVSAENASDNDLEEIVRKIYLIVNVYFPATFQEMKGKMRKKEIVVCRHTIIYFIKEIYKRKFSVKTIGSAIGLRDHSTVLHACNSIQDSIDTDRKFKNTINQIRMDLNQMGL